MRIITGSLKGRRIPMPKGVETRPTSDRTKEGMFGVITARKYFEGTTVLDLFAGSGNLAFEAISRGSERAILIEQERSCIQQINKTAESFGVSDKISVFPADVWNYVNGPSNPYDFVFADPPYDYPYMAELIDVVVGKGWLADDGWFILEHDRRNDFTMHPHCVFSKPYGRTIVAIFLNHPVIAGEEEE